MRARWCARARVCLFYMRGSVCSMRAELSRGCGMIRAKSSTTQVCFICGVAGCEIWGWLALAFSLPLSPSLSVYLSILDPLYAAHPRWITMICRPSGRTLSKIRRRSSSAVHPSLARWSERKRAGAKGDCGIMQSPGVLRGANYLCYTSGILYTSISIYDVRAGISMSPG